MQWKQNRTSKQWFQGCCSYPTCNGTRRQNGSTSTPTPQTIHNHSHIVNMLKAAVLSSEDECLVIDEPDFDKAKLYELHVDEVPEERKWFVHVKLKGTP